MERNQQIIEMRKSGKTIIAIAKEFNLSTTRISNIYYLIKEPAC